MNKELNFFFWKLVRLLSKLYFFSLTGFRRKHDRERLRITLPNEQNTDTKWVFIGISLTVFFTAVTVAIGIIRFCSKPSKGNIFYSNLIQV